MSLLAAQEHVNSHSGVFGNEQADVLAKRGATRFSFTNLHKRKPTLPDEYVTKPEDCDYEEDHEVQPFEP